MYRDNFSGRSLLSTKEPGSSERELVLDTVVSLMIVNADAERNRGKYLEANRLYKKTLDLVFGTSLTSSRLSALKGLAFSYFLMGDFASGEKVESIHLRSLERDFSRRSELDFNAKQSLVKEFMSCLAKVSILRIILGELGAAHVTLQRLLILARELFAGETERIVPGLNISAAVSFRLGLFSEAEALYREAIEYNEEQLLVDNGTVGDVTQDLIDSLKGLGISLCAQGSEKHGRLYCSVACASQSAQAKKKEITSELSELVQQFCVRDEFLYIKPICETAQDITLISEAADEVGKIKAYARLVKSLVPEFRTDEIDLRIERLCMAA